MGELIGTLDERTLLSEFTIDSLQPLARAYWEMTSYEVHPTQFARRFGEEKGEVQVFFPGPVARYKMLNHSYRIGIFQNGGDIEQARELHRKILAYATMNGTGL